MLLLLLLSHFSCVRLCATPWTAPHQAPPSLGFSRQEHWSGLPFPSPMQESEKWKWSRSVMPTRLLRPWDFPGKSTGVGCHCLLRGTESYLIFKIIFNWAESLLLRACYSLLAMHELLIAVSFIAEHGLQGAQASVAVALGLSCGMWNLPRSGIETVSPALGRQILNHWTTREALIWF